MLKKTFSTGIFIMLILSVLFVSCEQNMNEIPKGSEKSDLVTVFFSKLEAKSVDVTAGTVQTPDISGYYYQYKAIRNSGGPSGEPAGQAENWTDFSTSGLNETIQVSRGNWTISLRCFATEELRTQAGNKVTEQTKALFEGSITQDIGTDLTQRTQRVDIGMRFTNPEGMGNYEMTVTLPSVYASQNSQVKVTFTDAKGNATSLNHTYTTEDMSHTFVFENLNNGIAEVKLEYLDSAGVSIGDSVSAKLLIMSGMTTTGSAFITETNTFRLQLGGAFVSETAEDVYGPFYLKSIFDVYPDNISDTDIVVGYKNAEGTALTYPCEIPVDTPKDSEGRFTATILGLTPVTVQNIDELNTTAAEEAWFAPGAATGWDGNDNNYTLKKARMTAAPEITPEAMFFGCTVLTDVVIPEGVKTLNYSMFEDCWALKDITIPSSVTSMLSGCLGYTGLESFVIPENLTELEDILYGCSSLTSVTLPANLNVLPGSMFSDCTSLETINIPDGVTTIESAAFQNCTALSSITVPNSVTSIEQEAFDGCTNLRNVTLPSNITEINSSTFNGCSLLESILLPESITQLNWQAFKGCSSLTSITIPAGVTKLGDNAFENCSSLVSINIPDTVNEIGWDCFDNTAIEYICIPSSITRMADNPFDGCNNLTAVYVNKPEGSFSFEVPTGCQIYWNSTGPVIETYEGTKREYYETHDEISETSRITCNDGVIEFSKTKGVITGYTVAGKAMSSVTIYPTMVYDNNFRINKANLTDVYADMYENTTFYKVYVDSIENLSDAYFVEDNTGWGGDVLNTTATFHYKEMTEAKKNFGFIFYDAGAEDGVAYTFYNEAGNIIPYDNPSGTTGNKGMVGKLADAVRVEINGTPTKDRFYAYYPEAFPAEGENGYYFGFLKNTDIATGTANVAIGKGKDNTSFIMNYITDNNLWDETDSLEASVADASDVTSISKDSHATYNLYKNIKNRWTPETITYIWDWLKTFRTSNGANWYVPSSGELYQLVSNTRYTPGNNSGSAHFGIGIPVPFQSGEYNYISSTTSVDPDTSEDTGYVLSYSYRYEDPEWTIDRNSESRVIPIRSF